MNDVGFQPSSVPTVLKYPAENPPVNAPLNLRLLFSSYTASFDTRFGIPIVEFFLFFEPAAMQPHLNQEEYDQYI